jgi:hypothetical protein
MTLSNKKVGLGKTTVRSSPIFAIAKIGAKEEPCGENPKKESTRQYKNGEVKREGSVDDDLGLGWELDLGIRRESKTSKRAEGVFRENPKIKQIIYLLLNRGFRAWAIVKHLL